MTAQIETVVQTGGTVGDWRDQAVCAAVDPELFFPTAAGGRELARQEATAKAVCARCPVLLQCRTWAIPSLPHGVAGGLTEAERRDSRTGEAGDRLAVPIRATRPEKAAAGRAALRCGRSPASVAHEFGVSERTAQRWAAQITHQEADEGTGGYRAPVLISHSNTQAGTAMEGHRG